MKNSHKVKLFAVSSLLALSLMAPMTAAAEAQEHGYYLYDYETKKETFIPLEEYSDLRDENELKPLRVGESVVYETEPYTPESLRDDEASPFSVIGSDDRVIVNPNQSPYCRIIALRMGQDKDGDGKAESWYLGTGFMEGPDCFVTAAHCMWDEEYGNVEEMRLYPRQNGSSYGDVFYYPLQWITPAEYKNGDDNYDWCIVKLQNNLGDSLGWFGKSTGSVLSKEVIVGGYPADYNGRQTTSVGRVTWENTYRLNHTADTKGGSSGGPIYASNGMVYAIHTNGATSYYNGGVRITKRMFDIMQRYYLEGVEKWH
ncbi:MAG: trypsin-like peptidase domain-containing protein [Peptoniphilaceae bacterium]|nr:trypsin-like peptidase domain-containing protein [Peptoniphilaceae bacterium]MDY6085574.1 trypsin-like peptidase domain-containing protein [Peptoniphilaceae bacterium]